MASAAAALTNRAAAPMLLALCLVVGGASAAAPFANAALQLVSVVLIGLVLWQPAPSAGRLGSWPLRILAFAAGIMVMQCVPLPPAIWSSLPDADAVLAGFRLAAIPPGWSPLSRAPDDTVAAMLALLPPTAMLVCTLRSPAGTRDVAILLLVVSATGMTVLGVAQQIGGEDSILYPYRVTNPGQAVGLFANRNHLATLLLCALPFVAAMARTGNAADRGRLAVLGGTAAILCGGVVLVHSDAGLLMLPAVLAGCGAILMKGHRVPRPWRPGVVVGMATILVVLVTMAGAVALHGEARHSAAADQRREVIIPTTMHAALDTMPFGTGGGSFRTVYPAYGDPAAASLEYVNHAHSDYVELLLEYGIGGGAIALMALAVLIGLAVSAWRQPGIAGDRARAAVIALIVIAVHSAVDYPLRTAALAAVAGLATALAAMPASTAPFRREARPGRSNHGRGTHAILIEDL